jgi:hypothetical protein
MTRLGPALCVLVILGLAAPSAARDTLRAYGGEGDEAAGVVVERPDGTLVLAATTSSFGLGDDDVLVLEVAPDGAVVGERAWGTPQREKVGRLVLLPDGDLLLAGSSEDTATGQRTGFVLRLDPAGDEVWQRRLTVPTSLGFFGPAAVASPDGGVYLAFGEEIERPALEVIWLASLDGDGNLLWSERLNGRGPDVVGDLAARPGGGGIVTAVCGSFDATTFDVRLVAFGPDGTVEWQRILDAGVPEFPTRLLRAADGTWLMGGYAGDLVDSSFDFAWLTRLTADGDVLWSESLRGPDRVHGLEVVPLPDGGAAVFGEGWLRDPGGVPGDLWSGRVDAAGGLSWQRAFGGEDWESCGHGLVRSAGAGTLVAAGMTASFGAGGSDLLLLELDDAPDVTPDCDAVHEGDWSVAPLTWGVRAPAPERTVQALGVGPGDLAPSETAVHVQEQCASAPRIHRPLVRPPSAVPGRLVAPRRLPRGE